MIGQGLFYLRSAIGAMPFAKRHLLHARNRELKRFLASGQRVTFPKPRSPRATLIIPVFNHALHTLACLMSILPAAGDWLEVLVQDDGSTDETSELLSRFENLRVARNPTNLGYLRSVNAAVVEARGRHVILMNNDARLVEGSLVAMLGYMEAHEDIGLLGCRIVQPNGGLQEAGCALFRDGTSNGYLRFRPADDPRALFIRDVDYCSGVFAIIPKVAFERLGGFDEIYAPAYYEETDLCMRLAREGLRSVYHPGLVVEHFEFGSRPSGDLRALIERHRAVFMQRWGETLRSGGFGDKILTGVSEASARRLQKPPRRLLVIDQAACTKEAVIAASQGAGTLAVLVHDASHQQLLAHIRAHDFAYEFRRGPLSRYQGLFDEVRFKGDKASRFADRE